MVETCVELLPETNFVSSFYFVEETVDSCDSLGFVVTSQNDNLIWVSDFQSEEEADDFAGLAATVYVITHEQVSLVFIQDNFLLIRLIFVSHFFEHVQKFSKLTMYVAKNFNWRFKGRC